MSNTIEISGDITPEVLKEILEKALPGTPVSMVGDEAEGIGGIKIGLKNVFATEGEGGGAELLAVKNKLKTSEATATKALASIRPFTSSRRHSLMSLCFCVSVMTTRRSVFWRFYGYIAASTTPICVKFLTLKTQVSS